MIGTAFRWVLWAALLTASGAAFAIAIAIAWSSLTTDQRALLAGFETQWDRLGATQQQQLLHNAEFWQRLDPAAQAELLARLGEWQSLPAPLRARLRARFAVYQALTADQQRALAQHLEQWRNTDPAARDAQRARFAAVPSSERRTLLVTDDARRQQAEFAQQVFAFVPEGERPGTLEMLNTLSADGRALLERAVQRMAPWQREELRRELLALPSEARAGYLREQAARR